MSADSDAFQAALGLGLSSAETQYLVTIARGEGFYGLGWGSLPKPGSKIESETHAIGLIGNEGAGSKNWGAVQGRGSAGSFYHLDHHADGSPYKGTFKRYSTDTEAAADVARILLKPNVKFALAIGDLHGAVMAQYANGYFELAPEKYYATVVQNYRALLQNLNWPNLLMNPANLSPNAPEVAKQPLPLSSGFLASEWGPQSSAELSESDLELRAENYLKGVPDHAEETDS